jgi:D-alanyl-lipoteichoic acid acyltransferase DltB (MBOAT superfamily)
VTLRGLHDGLAWALILTNAIAGVWLVAAQYVAALRIRPVWWLVVVAQATTFAIAIVGVLIVRREGVELDQFHALYGFSAIVAVGILYSYRGSPFVRDKLHLLYGIGSLFIMGLGIRASFLS